MQPQKVRIKGLPPTDTCAVRDAEGVVYGKSDRIFAPNDNLTRGESCTMLWRMFGKQSVEGMTCPFPDAKASNHYKGILWCYNKGIITGYPTEDGRPAFKPGRTISRGNILVMLFKLAKKEAGYTPAAISNPFKDVKDGNKNLAAYKWAYQNKVTRDKTLSPGTACKRSAMVSFLYGYNNKYHVIR